MHKVIIEDTGIPDEHLYGRAGYLAAVMFVQSQLGDDAIHTNIIRKVHVYTFYIYIYIYIYIYFEKIVGQRKVKLPTAAMVPI